MSTPLPTSELISVLVGNHRRFRAFLQRRVGDASDAEDILQAAFLKSVERGDTVRDGETVVAWFYRLLRNALIDYYRQRDAERRALGRIAGLRIDTAEPEHAVERAICLCVHDLLPTINQDYAALLRRVDLDGVSIADVAAEAGMTPNNVRVKLHRARAALRKKLELSCGTCTEHGCLDCSCARSPRQHD
ncbi:MAG: sigma-70 family RNA polymerase sigma factor [Gemmatimonadales bacterium]|nr:sigma-70 family RNA polymerase sigma factor [Gemmatimonadales bacterium]NIN12080.1 sigma-70 family RNA polymerase sigma factor [Gemmatimonadales bacterium]NIR03315.1 sigma-70 family RNA polymerase sigma factor [Gemmatimonadales bacterium]NIS66995.1 sigma-70 family RNA polymerase sigma factor [Gemmatimonadales bacterium]